jgi:hypothetical protein
MHGHMDVKTYNVVQLVAVYTIDKIRKWVQCLMNILNYDKSAKWLTLFLSLYLGDRLTQCVELPVCINDGNWTGKLLSYLVCSGYRLVTLDKA